MTRKMLITGLTDPTERDRDDPALESDPPCPHASLDLNLRICGECDAYLPDPDQPQFEFRTGMAGTGKSYLWRVRAERDPSIVLMATTGIAAINLGTGSTINAKLFYYDTNELQAHYTIGRLTRRLVELGSTGRTHLVLDEVSMMDGRQLDTLMLGIDDANRILDGRKEAPIGLTLVGDFCQLPPVKAPFAFTMRSWERFAPYVTHLTTFHRQVDPQFLAGLYAARSGDPAGVVAAFQGQLVSGMQHSFDGTTILATNEEVDRHNKARLYSLAGNPVLLPSYRAGQVAAEWVHIPEQLALKVHALVMILSNGYDGRGPTRELVYANGDLARVVEIHPPTSPVDQASFTPFDNPEQYSCGSVTVRLLRNNRTYTIGGLGRIRTKPHGSKTKREDLVGWIRYIPLRVAYATTCHKSQGLTLDRIQVDLSNNFWKRTPGMLYVALSRCRTLDGLTISATSATLASRTTINPLVQPWV